MAAFLRVLNAERKLTHLSVVFANQLAVAFEGLSNLQPLQSEESTQSDSVDQETAVLVIYSSGFPSLRAHSLFLTYDLDWWKKYAEVRSSLSEAKNDKSITTAFVVTTLRTAPPIFITSLRP
jgi:hypothetical protein